MTPVRALTALALVLLLPLAAGAAPRAPHGPAYVTRVVDGDTLFAELGGRLEAVRYLGVNTPRIEHPTRGPQPYADAAREANRRLVEGRWIYLVFEDQPRDRHGRLLAYVWRGDLLVNAALVHAGYAEAAVMTTMTPYGEYFRMLEAGARRDRRGVWRDAEAVAYHRPRPAVTAEEDLTYDERPADASGGRVFSAPAPFIPLTSPGAAHPGAGGPSVGVPGGAVAPRSGSPSYVVPPGATRPR
jgi:micrococcal nuclease